MHHPGLLGELTGLDLWGREGKDSTRERAENGEREEGGGQKGM